MNKLIVYVHYSLYDPLFYGNLFLYLKYHTQCSKTKILLITHESKKFKIQDKAELNKIKKELKNRYNILWIPLSWETNSLFFIKLLRKFYEFSLAFLVIAYYRLFHKYKHITTVGTVTGSIIILFSKILKIKFLMYQCEPHSEYMLDAHIVTKNDWTFKLLQYFEKSIYQNADFICTTTNNMINRLINEGRTRNVFLIPSCVDDNYFSYDSNQRKALREKFNINDSDKVILYAGKFGDLYYSIEVPLFFKALKKIDSSWKILVLTLQDKNYVTQLFDKAGLLKNEYILLCDIKYTEIKNYYSLADIGLISVSPTPSNIYRSSIKIGEYLCCGLPYIICKGIGEDDIMAEKHNVGVVLNELTEQELKKNYSKILNLISEDKSTISKRCREVGIHYRGLSNLNPKMNNILNQFLSLS